MGKSSVDFSFSPFSFIYEIIFSPSSIEHETLKIPFYWSISINYSTVVSPFNSINFCFNKVRIKGIVYPFSIYEGRKEGSTPKTIDFDVAEMLIKSRFLSDERRMSLDSFVEL